MSYNVTLWRVRVTIEWRGKVKMHSGSVVGLLVTVNYVNIITVAHQCFRSPCKVPDAALQTKKVGLLVTLFRGTIWLSRQ
jgi:hypothetical protein